MANFCKNEDCPPSQELLAFQNGDLEVSESGPIRKHLAVCEFCAAEVEFYGLFPPAEEKVEPESMPTPLRELAEALLKDKRDQHSFYELIED